MSFQIPLTISKNGRESVDRLTHTLYGYHRIGYDHRLMTFLADGSVGRGARSRELSWNLRHKKSKLYLEICSEDAVTCRLMEGPDLTWRGQWVDYERMPVELIPIANLPAKSGLTTGCCVFDHVPESVFVVSLPRSLSTLVYDQVRLSVGLCSPEWTSDGEVLNVDRYSLFSGPTDDTNEKFTGRESNPVSFYAAADFLDQLVQPVGFAYKDVVQPFIIVAWLKTNRIRAIRIKRNLADIAYSMLARGWRYPARSAKSAARHESALMEGLVRAERALDFVCAQTIDFDQLIDDETPLETALHNLFGTRPLGPVRYIDESFREIRSEVLERRKTRKHKRLAGYLS